MMPRTWDWLILSRLRRILSLGMEDLGQISTEWVPSGTSEILAKRSIHRWAERHHGVLGVGLGAVSDSFLSLGPYNTMTCFSETYLVSPHSVPLSTYTIPS